MLNLKITAFLLLTSFIAKAQLTPTSPIESNQLTQAYETKDYSIEFPSTWELDTSGQVGTKFFLFSMLSSSKDQFRENINLVTEDLSNKNVNLNQYVELAEQQIARIITNYKLIENKRMKHHGLEFHKLIYQGKQGILKLVFEQYCWVIDEEAFILTLSCEKKQFKTYQQVGEKILNSFKFKKEAP